MNKSLITNILALLAIGASYLSPVFQTQIKTMGLFALSGALTNWLAIHMLFEKVPGLYGSGIVTERFEEFKAGIHSLMMNQFFTSENVAKFLSSSSLEIDEKEICHHIDFDSVFIKIKAAIMESPFGGMLGMFGGEAALDPLKENFEPKFYEMVSDIIKDEKFQENLSSKAMNPSSVVAKVTDIVSGRLDEMSPEMVKTIIQDMIKKHLGWLVVWGGVFGAIIGLISTLV